MSDWIEPEVDWDIEKEPQPADLNRIENDLKHLKEGNTEFTGNKNFSGNNNYSGNNVHTGQETFSDNFQIDSAGNAQFNELEALGSFKLNLASKGSQSIANSSSWVVPQGVYYFMQRSDSRTEIYISTGTWQTAAYENLGIVISDGVNVRIRNLGATRDFYYLKF